MAREMKDSGVKWIGEFPINWNVWRLKYVVDTVSEIGLNGVKIGLENIESKSGKFVPTDSEYEGIGQVVHKGEIVYGKLRPYLCKAWKAEFECNAVGDFYVFRCNPSGDSSFIQKVLVSNQFNEICSAATYGTKMPRVSLEYIKSIPIPLPPLSEQKAIADFLDKKCAEIDGLLADLEAEVKTLAEYKKSIIAETVTRGLNPNAPMKQSGIPWTETIPAHWVSEKFRYKLKVRRVTGQGDKQVLSVYREYGVVPKDGRDDNHNVTSEDTSKYKYVRPNDFVINKMKAWQGSMGVSDHEGIVSPAYFVYGFSDDDYNPRYFHYFMRNANNIPEYRRLSGGIREGQWDLSPYDLGNMLVIVPPKAEQNEIVAFLDEKCAAIEQSIADKQTQIETLKAYKSSLIYEYVTGKKQVI